MFPVKVKKVLLNFKPYWYTRQLRIQEFKNPLGWGGGKRRYRRGWFLGSEICFDAPFTHTLCFVVKVENKVHIINIVWWILLKYMLVIQSKFKNTKPLDTALHGTNEVDKAEKSAPIEIVHLQTLKISLNSLKQKYWDFCDTIFKIKSTYQIILISNAVTKLLFQEFVSYQSNSYSYIPFKGWTPNQSAYFVIVLWVYIIYFWSVPTPYTWGTYFLIT